MSATQANARAALPLERQLALAHFESFYAAIGRAIDDEDAERVATLVDQRKAALEALLEAFAGEHLPEPVRAHIEGSEAMVRTRLLRFFDHIIVRLSEERSRSHAAGRYQELSR